jgi:hypothetical protein
MTPVCACKVRGLGAPPRLARRTISMMRVRSSIPPPSCEPNGGGWQRETGRAEKGEARTSRVAFGYPGSRRGRWSRPGAGEGRRAQLWGAVGRRRSSVGGGGVGRGSPSYGCGRLCVCGAGGIVAQRPTCRAGASKLVGSRETAVEETGEAVTSGVTDGEGTTGLSRPTSDSSPGHARRGQSALVLCWFGHALESRGLSRHTRQPGRCLASHSRRAPCPYLHQAAKTRVGRSLGADRTIVRGREGARRGIRRVDSGSGG